MNTEEIKQKLVAFWDSHFAGGQAMTITKSDIVLDTPRMSAYRFLAIRLTPSSM